MLDRKDLVTAVIIYLVKIWQDLCLKLKPKTKTKNQKPNFFVVDISTLLYTLKRRTRNVFLSHLFKVYKKVVEFSFTPAKIFWVLVFSFSFS